MGTKQNQKVLRNKKKKKKKDFLMFGFTVENMILIYIFFPQQDYVWNLEIIRERKKNTKEYDFSHV